MAEESKTTFKAVDIEFDPITAEPIIKDVEIPEEGEENTEGADDNTEGTDDNTEGAEGEDANDQEDDQEGEGEDSDSDNSDNSDSEDSDDDDSEGDSDEDLDDDGADDGADDASQEEEQDEEDIVGYDELPESIQAALDFMEDTGGSLQDFLEVNQDFSKLPQDEVIGKFLKGKYPTLDSDDISYEIESRFGANEEDSEAQIRRKKVEKKKFYAEALGSLQANADKYKTELGSSAGLSAQAQEAINFKKNYETQQTQSSKQLETARSSFIKGTNKLLGKNFKGFEVKVGEKAVIYKPENVTKLKEQNLDVNNVLGRYLDDKGNVTDIEGYHKMMAVASNPEAFAEHFFELGKAAMAEEDERDSKNIKDKPRGTKANPKQPNRPKFKFLDSKSDFDKGKIKLRNY